MPSATSPVSVRAESPTANAPHGVRNLALYLGSWFATATALGASGVLFTLPRFVFPVVIWGSFFALLAFCRYEPGVRAALTRIPLAVPLAFHAVVRTGYGVGIIAEGERGGLPRLFADVAGPGDVFVGILAVAALLCALRPTPMARYALLAWNVIGLADILVAVVLGQLEVLFGRGPTAFAAAAHFPFAWLPTFVVPLVVATHLWMFARLRSKGSEAAPRE